VRCINALDVFGVWRKARKMPLLALLRHAMATVKVRRLAGTIPCLNIYQCMPCSMTML